MMEPYKFEDQFLADAAGSLPLRAATSKLWVQGVLASFDLFLLDHCACERKAHAAAMMMVNRYPEYRRFQTSMVRLAKEELEHFSMVLDLVHERELSLPPDQVNPYVQGLFQHVRHPKTLHLLDKLLAVAVIEARSAERFCLVADAARDPVIKDFYRKFAMDECRHIDLFLEEAKVIFGEDAVQERLCFFLETEASLVRSLPLRVAVH